MIERAQQRFAERPVSGASYRRATRIVAVAVSALVVVMVARWLIQLPERDWTLVGGALLAMLPLLYWLPTVLYGQTRIDGRGIRQDGMFGREVEWHQIQRVRFSRALLQPRLMVSAGFPKIRSFYSGTPQLDDAFDEIETIFMPR
ncbi:MAG TPA: hypothetical protein VM491_11990 [Burkholderiaceae bacterium]|nr:hypothetical protein [Burkholderiaceae bacterium]